MTSRSLSVYDQSRMTDREANESVDYLFMMVEAERPETHYRTEWGQSRLKFTR